jgi:hypothetical protein
MSIESLTTEEKNRIITEKLFGLKVIYPQTYYAELKGRNADEWRKQAPGNNDPVVVKNNKPLKTHYIDSYPMPNFYKGSKSYELIPQARARLQEKNLHLRFAEILAESFKPPDFRKNLHWNLIDAAPGVQADAIVRVLLENS